MKHVTLISIVLLGLTLGLARAHADFYFQVGDQAEYAYRKSVDQETNTTLIVRVKDVTLQSITFESAIQTDGHARTCETTIARQELLSGDVNATGCTGVDLILPPSANVIENRPESVVTEAGEFMSEYSKYESNQRKNHETWVSQDVPVFGVVKQNRGKGSLSLKSFQISQ